MNERQAYTSDLSDDQFGVIKRFIPNPKPGGRPPKYDRREIVNGIMYVLRSGCAWRMIPHDLPTWRITYHYFREWKLDGTWERIHDRLRGDLRKACGRERMPSAGIIVSRSVKTTEKGGHTAMMQARKSTVESATSLLMSSD
jgi:putative transposase